jgi:DNA ligase 1
MENLEELNKIFNELKNTSSRLGKEQILADNKDNELFKSVLKFMYDPYIVTGLSKTKINKQMDNGWLFSFDEMEDNSTLVEIIDYLKKNNTGKDADIYKVNSYLGSHREYDDMLKDIFTKDLTLGIQASTINKVYGEGFIPTFSVMLAEKYSERPEWVSGKEFLLTIKLDGTRLVAVVDDNIELFTRQGQLVTGMVDIEEELKQLPKGYVYDGELIAEVKSELESKDLFRETISRARRDGTKTGIIYHIFDMVPIDEFKKGVGSVTASERKHQLHKIFSSIQHPFRWLKEVEVLYEGNDEDYIQTYLDSITNNGGEGVMINISNAPYECKRTKNLLKVKKFNTADVRITDVYEGTGKYVGKLGGISIQFEHKGQLWNCDVGSGFTDEEREFYWKNKDKLLNKIVEIKYFEISQDASGVYSLRFPTWVGRIRDDKEEISMY